MLFASAETATCQWGFSTVAIVTMCVKHDALVAITEDGTKYGLNGLARSRLKLPSIEPIWKSRSDLPNAKIDLTPWMNATRTLCD